MVNKLSFLIYSQEDSWWNHENITFNQLYYFILFFFKNAYIGS